MPNLNHLTDGPFRWWVPLVAYLAMMPILIGASLIGLPPQLGQMVAFVLYVVFATAIAAASRPMRAALGLNRPVSILVILMVAFAATVATSLIELIGRQFSTDIANSTPIVLERMGLGTSLWVDLALIVTICCLAPLGEEAIFRGLIFKGIFDTLRRWGGAWGRLWVAFAIAAVVSAVLFAQSHGGEGQEASVVFALGLSGLIFAACYALTGSLWTAVMAHCLNNTLAMATALWGQDDVAMISKLAIGAMPLLTWAFMYLWARALPQAT